MFAVLVILQAYVLKETVAVLQQPAGMDGSMQWQGMDGRDGIARIAGLFEWSVALIVLISVLNLGYTYGEIKSIWPWVRKSPEVLFEFWGEKSVALFPDGPGCSSVAGVMCILYLIPSALLALFVVPPFVLCYLLYKILYHCVYKHLKTDAWNTVDLIYISLVWASLGYHIRLLALLADRGADQNNHMGDAASLTTATPRELLSTLSTTALNIAGWSIVFVGLRLLAFFRSQRTIGPLIALIIAVIRDMLPFVFVLILLMVFGALAMPLLMGVLDQATINADGPMAGDGFADPQRSFLTIYMWINGDWDAGALEKKYGALLYFYVFLLVSSIIMMNLLIAIMGDSFERVRAQQKVQTRIVLAQIIHDIERTMPKNEKDRSRWHRCLPKWLKPRCKDDLDLNPAAVLVVVKGTDTDINGNNGDDDAEWGGRLAEMRKTMDAQFKVIRQEADDRAVTVDARAATADTRAMQADERAATADARALKAEAAMDAILALLKGGGGEEKDDEEKKPVV